MSNETREKIKSVLTAIKEWWLIVGTAVMVWSAFNNLPIIQSLKMIPKAIPAMMVKQDTLTAQVYRLENALYHSQDIIDSGVKKAPYIISLHRRIDTLDNKLAVLNTEVTTWHLQSYGSQ